MVCEYLVIEPESMDERVRILKPEAGCHRVGGGEPGSDIILGGCSASASMLFFVANGDIMAQTVEGGDPVELDGKPFPEDCAVLLRPEHNVIIGGYLLYVLEKLQPGMEAEVSIPGLLDDAVGELRKPLRGEAPAGGDGQTQRSGATHEDTVRFADAKREDDDGDEYEGRYIFPPMPPIAKEAQAEVDRFIYGRLKPLFDKLMKERTVRAEEAREAAEETLDGVLKQQEQHLPSSLNFETAKRHCIASFMEYGPLQALLGDESITEIMVNGPEEIFIESRGKLVKSHMRFWDQQELRRVIEKMVAITNRHIDETQPYQDTRLEDGSRVNVIIRPVALSGDSITIRKFPNKRLYVEDLIRFGALSKNMADFLRMIVQHKANVIVSGGTGSGKTTLLNVLSSFIPDDERLVSIEDAAELRLAQPNKVCLESKPKSAEGGRAVTIRDLVINALRMRPDRIVVGECRGGEAMDMLQAMNTGHEGSLTTLHANSPRDAIGRIETMCLMSGMELPAKAIRSQLVSAINFIVQQSRFVDGSRKISSIQEVIGMEGDQVIMQEIFKYERLGMDHNNRIKGRFFATGVVPEYVQILRDNHVDFPLEFFADEEREEAMHRS